MLLFISVYLYNRIKKNNNKNSNIKGALWKYNIFNPPK